MLKNAFIMLVASVPFLGYSEDSTDCGQCCPLLPPEPIESCQLPVGYFYPAQYQFENCCVNYSVGAEFIYWEINQDSYLQFANRTTIDPINGNTIIEPIANQNGYSPGFKVNVGIGFPGYDNWDFNAEYTWNHRTWTKHYHAAGTFTDFLSGVFTSATFPGPASTVTSVRKLNLNFCQGTVGRPFYLSERLIVRPNVGIKTWWVAFQQDLFFDVTFFPDIPQAAQFTKCGGWGIGPFVGAQIQGLLWCGTYFLGKAGIWPAYTRINKYRIVSNYPAVDGVLPFPVNNTEIDGTFNYTTELFYEGGIGLGWGTYFCGCGYHTDISISYDFMTNYIRFQEASAGQPLNFFYYQGLSVRAQLDF